MGCVEIEVQFENVDARFTQEAELPAFGMLRNQIADIGFANPALFRHSGHLKFRRCGSDVRIQA